MPLTRYEIRNEYSIADPELYKVADKDDPEAILEGVAMAGLVGLLRQLGDLAEFAAEIFHDLHEEVMSTAARGHGLIVRVQQLEAEFPIIERKLLSQTRHTSFLYSSSVDWHPNLLLDQNTITQGDLPRFVMDSYEECRGPPRLFLLDKFDVAGAGACLKRFTDPSFFKTESASSTGSKFEIQREKKTRRVKKRGSRWRNGETPESFPSSHAKLHQLFLEERAGSGGNDPDRRVKLKKRQFTGSLFDQENTKSYMEKFLDTCAPKQRIIHDSIDPLPLTWTSNNASGLEKVEIGVASPLKEPLEFGQRFSSSPDTGDIAEKPRSDGFNGRNSEVCIDGEALEVLGLNDSSYDGKISSAITRVVNANDFGDRESKSGASIDTGCDSEDVASEIDNYEDALATIDSEVDTDSEWNKYQRYLRQPIVVDSDGSLEQPRLQGGYTDSQSVSNSATSAATSEGGDNLFRERGSSSLCNSVISLSSEEITGNESEKHAMVHRADIKTNNVPKAGEEPGNISDTSYIRDTKIYSVDMDAHLADNSLQMDGAYSNFSDNYIISRETRHGHPGTSSCLANQTVPERPEKADNGYCSSEYSTHEKSGHVSEFLQIESHNAHSVCSSIDKHTRDMEQPCNSDNKTPENIDTICVATEQGFTNPFSTQDFEKEFSIQEKHSETIHCAPSPDDIAALCSREDPSFEVASIPAEHEHRISSAHTAVQAEKSSSIDNMLQGTAPKLSSSGNTEASEIVEGSSLENGEVGTDSFENIIIGEKFPGFSDKEIVLDSRKIDKPSSSLDLLKYEDGLHNLVSVINDQTNSGVICHLDDCQINDAALRGDSNKIEDESSAISNDTNLSESGVPCTRADEPGSVKVTENNSNFETHLENLEPVETIIDSSRPDNCKDDHDKKLDPLPSPVHPGMFQDQLLSVSEECNQNGDDLTKGHGSESTQNNLMDPVLDALVDPTLNLWNVSTDLSSSVLTSANSVQYVDAASSEQIHLPEVKDNYVDSSMHSLLKSLSPEKAVDIAAPVTPFYSAYGASHVPHNFAMDIQTPDFVERDSHWYAPAANNQYEPFVSKPLPLSAEHRLEATTESSVRGMTIGDNHAFGPEMQLVYPPSDHRANEEPPPLPPLPPMQWRLGRLQNSSSAPDSQLVHRRPDQVQPTGLPGVHHTREPAQTMSQTTALYAPARLHTFAPVASMDVPALVHQTVAIAPTSWNTGQPVTSDGNVALQGADILPRAPAVCEGFAVPAAFGYMALEGGFGLPMQGAVSQGSSHDNQSFFAPLTSTEPHSASQITELFHQPYVTPPDSGSVNGIPTEHNLEGLEATVNPDLGASIELPVSNKTEQEAVNSSVQSLPLLTDHQSSAGFVASQTEIAWLSSYNGSPTHAGGNTNGSVQKKLPRPRNPLIDEVVAIDKSKFRKVERVKPSLKKSEARESILEQMQLRKVKKVKQPVETNTSEGGYVLEQLQLRKVEKRVKPPIEPKSEEWEFLPEQLQLKKVGERSKPEAGSKAEETDSPRVQLRKLSERVNQEIGARMEETGSPQVQLRKVSDKVIKQEIEARTVEIGPPRVQLRKVGDRVKQEIGATTEETESPRALLRKVGEKTSSAVESKTEEKDSLFEQIRNKSFSLKPAVAARPNIQGPRTNLKVAAILEKASNIRQAMAGSDEDDDTDTWE